MQSYREDFIFLRRLANIHRIGRLPFKKGVVKHIFFVAETKGTLQSMELRAIEKAKISCVEKLFEKLSNGEVHYGQVKDYKSLMDIVLDK